MFLILFIATLSPALRAADHPLPFATESVNDIAARQTAMRRWKISLAPLIASQTLDVTSSWGMRELNPLLVPPNGGFGMKSAVIKFGVTGVLIGVEYMLIRKSPRAARRFEKWNWSGAAVNTGLAIHNYAIQ
jgi:hypothetical protein